MKKTVDPVSEAEALAKAEAARRGEAQEPEPTFELPAAEARRFERAGRIVITSAMNNAKVDQRFWASLCRYAAHNEAEILVLPTRYRNPTTPGEAQKESRRMWWAPEVTQHLASNRLKLHPLLWVMGDVPVAATALNPLVGLDALTRGVSGIFGHAQLAMETVPTPQNVLPKILHTTGAVTKAEYSRSKAGRRAEFHHTLAALVVEKSGKKFHLRQLIADSSGGFYDIAGGEARYYHPKGSHKADRATALVTGDTHVDRVDPKVVESTYGKGGLVELVRPEFLVWHDLLDFQSDSHWNNAVERIALALSGKHDVRAEVLRAIEFVDRHTPEGVQSVVVSSNHHDHLSRWALERDWRHVESVNVEFLLELQLALVRGAKAKAHGVDQADPLALWASKQNSKARFLRYGESFRKLGVEMGLHGHRGPNGSRGSRKNIDKIGTRTFIAHAHTPGIYRGANQVGTSSLLNLSYGVGSPSSWLHTHGILWPNGKRQLVNIIDGEYRA